MNSLLIKESTWAHKERSENRWSTTKAEFSLSSDQKTALQKICPLRLAQLKLLLMMEQQRHNSLIVSQAGQTELF